MTNMSKRKLPSHKLAQVETWGCTRTKPTSFMRAAQSIDAAQQRFLYQQLREVVCHWQW